MVKRKSTKTFVVLYGDRGTSKEFKSKEKAIALGKKIKLASPKKEVTIDRITTYTPVRRTPYGKVDWSQGFVKKIEIQKKKRKIRK